ncbi:MAG: oligosaccharide flippase family protein [Acidobacteria bacterium]|nr:oligosaccharide flippase family protein [Acidobacteriota bacterium]MCB9377714.1 oligosaccharide flippase family protein [Holophagales bacterium]
MTAHDTARGLLRSSAAATLAQLVRMSALLATHIVVRRFVGPATWGLWDWVQTVFLVLAALRDLGVPSQVVRLRPMPIGGLLRVEAGWGGALALAVAAAAPLVAGLMAEPSPETVAVVRALTIFLLLEGLTAVALAWFEANLRIERTLAPELARTAVYCALVLGGGMAGWGVWSFVAGQIGGQAVLCGWLWLRARGDGIELTPAAQGTRPLVRESLPLGVVWGLALAVTYVDPFLLGLLFPREAVGLYTFAYFLAFLVFRILQQPIGRALYPAFFAYRDDPARQFDAYRHATSLFLALEAPAALFLALNADRVVWLLGGDKYEGSARYLMLLAFAPLVDPLGRFGGEYLIARHLDRARVLSLALHLAALVVGGVLLCRWLGPIGMAWANFLPAGAPVVAWALWRTARGRLGRLARDLVEAYLAPALPFAAAWALSAPGGWARFALSIVAGLLCVAWLWRRRGDELLRFFRPADLPATPAQ